MNKYICVLSSSYPAEQMSWQDWVIYVKDEANKKVKVNKDYKKMLKVFGDNQLCVVSCCFSYQIESGWEDIDYQPIPLYQVIKYNTNEMNTLVILS